MYFSPTLLIHEEQAWVEAGEFLSKNYNIPAKPFERLAVHGSPEDCIARTRDSTLMPALNHIIIRFASFNPLQQLERWTKTLPALR